MINTVPNIEKFYSAKEAAKILKMVLISVQRHCKSGRLEATTIHANGGEQYRISHTALMKYAEKYNIKITSESESFSNSLEQGLAPISPAQGFSLLPLISKNTEKEAIPTKAKEIALARQDVLKVWEEFRNSAQKKTSADKDFITAFNSGIYCPELFQQIGAVSKGTLYRWKQVFEEVGNYTALVPQYNYRSIYEKETKLTNIEKKYFLDLLLQPSRVSIGNATRLVKYVLEKQGFKDVASAPTYRRFADWFKGVHCDVWTLMREGQKALVDKVAPYRNCRD